jgi:hypothetical protein
MSASKDEVCSGTIASAGRLDTPGTRAGRMAVSEERSAAEGTIVSIPPFRINRRSQCRIWSVSPSWKDTHCLKDAAVAPLDCQTRTPPPAPPAQPAMTLLGYLHGERVDATYLVVAVFRVGEDIRLSSPVGSHT